ncbi:MAG: hypothetical protein ACLQAH_06095 [Limisphaerales bacterium]
MDYVKHPQFSHEELDGKCVAYCTQEHPHKCLFQVRKVQPDGHHELAITWAELISVPGSEPKLISVPKEAVLGQDAVDKIVVPEVDSYVHQMGCDFAILLDDESGYLATRSIHQKPT